MPTQKEIGLEAVIRVKGFVDAQRWLHRLIDAGVLRCGARCDNPATHIFWQDQAEWYCRCERHREYGQQWSGSTRWNPSSFGAAVLPDAARAWYEALSPEDKALIELLEYDRTDYYSLLDDTKERQRFYLVGSKEEWHKVYVDVRPLTNGCFVYELSREWSDPKSLSGTCHSYGLVGAFDSVDEAVEAARTEEAQKQA